MERIQYINRSYKNSPLRIIEPGERAHAAVALILEEAPEGLNVLLIERSSNENDSWSGHIAFPGGRAETCDSSPRDTAERETLEEVGLNLSTARYIGRLSDIAPGRLNIVISCYVYLVNQRPVLQPDPREVANAFWFPLEELNNPGRRSQMEFKVHNRMRRFPAIKIYDGEEKLLWGLTYRMLRNFTRAINQSNNCGMVVVNSDPP